MGRGKQPLVSVIMPVYNGEQYLKEAIESILAQSYKNFEFIIIDDGSTDRTPQILEQYTKKDRRIRILRNKQNLRICKTLNKGIHTAKGAYLARMDADDISLPKRFEEQVRYLEAHPKCGIVGADIQLFETGTGKELGRRSYPVHDKDLRETIFFHSPFAHPVVMMRKSAVLTAGMYDPGCKESEDLDLWFRIGSHYEFGSIPNVLLRYRQHPDSLTKKRLRIMETFANKIRWKNSRNRAFTFGLSACIYNSFHFLSIYLVPTRIKLWAFAKWRDKVQ